MDIIRTGFCDGIDVRRRLSSVLRRVNRFLNLEFLKQVDGWRQHQVVQILISDRNAIEKIHVVADPLAADHDLAACLRERRPTRSDGCQIDVVAEQRQLHKLPSVEG